MEEPTEVEGRHPEGRGGGEGPEEVLRVAASDPLLTEGLYACVCVWVVGVVALELFAGPGKDGIFRP